MLLNLHYTASLLKKMRLCRPEKVPNALLDENVDINLIRLCFTDDAWMIVDSVLQQKVQRPNWLCHSCNHNLAKQPSIICVSCLQWNHLQCGAIWTAKSKTLVLSFLPLVICCDFQYSLHVCIYKHLFYLWCFRWCTIGHKC